MLPSFLLGLSVLAAAPPASPDAGLEAQLRATDQALLDAIGPGDRAAWDRVLAPDAVYVDENGTVMDRKAFLGAIVPLPSFASGTLKIVDYQLHRLGDVALVVHKDEEHERFHGVALRADYLMTETWVRKGSDWKLALVHAYVVPKDPPEISLSTEALDSLTGSYRLTEGVVYVIRREGDHLVGGTEGGHPHVLRAETADVFFIEGQPRSRKIFRRSADGRVTAMIDRREGEDLVYTRLPR